MKYTQTLFEKAGIKYNQGDLFKVHCTPVWNYHKETPSFYYRMLIQKYNKTYFKEQIETSNHE
jgi:hypothetical protein